MCSITSKQADMNHASTTLLYPPVGEKFNKKGSGRELL
jgi:hypothetical protein